MEELKKLIKENKVIMGTNMVMRNLKLGKLKQVYLASNCPETTREDIKHYAKLNNIKVNELKENNEELGTICKKPFSISVLGN
ncbi:MAG: 50S ribosomal protein L30e [Nanoarchaeota archaeon]